MPVGSGASRVKLWVTMAQAYLTMALHGLPPRYTDPETAFLLCTEGCLTGYEYVSRLFTQLNLDLKELDSPEELNPLKEALDRAKNRVDQSTSIREALEAEVCFSLGRYLYLHSHTTSDFLVMSLFAVCMLDCQDHEAVLATSTTRLQSAAAMHGSRNILASNAAEQMTNFVQECFDASAMLASMIVSRQLKLALCLNTCIAVLVCLS